MKNDSKNKNENNFDLLGQQNHLSADAADRRHEITSDTNDNNKPYNIFLNRRYLEEKGLLNVDHLLIAEESRDRSNISK